VAATLARRTDDEDLEARLDELIPRPAGPFKTLAVGVTVVGVAIAVTVLTIGGHLYPRPTFGSSFGSGSHLEVDQARNAVSATVILPNDGNRAVRITDISFDGLGAELVDVAVMVEPPDQTQSDAAPVIEEQTAEVAVPLTRGRLGAAPLPVMVPPDRTATIVVWFRPTECVDQPGPWGTVDATIDFGADAFPPFSNTISLAQDPIASVDDPNSTAVNGGDVLMLRNVDGAFTEVSGPLAGACEALR
jgi:hypothetical protein